MAIVTGALVAGSIGAGTLPMAQAGPPPAPRCTPADLTSTFKLEGAAGSLIGEIRLKNTSNSACSLRGRPTMTPLRANGTAYEVERTNVQPYWYVDGQPTPPGWPVTTVQPDERGRVRFSWSNWCAPNPPAKWRAHLPWGGNENVPQGDSTPPCNAPGQPTSIQVGPFEPGTIRTH